MKKFRKSKLQTGKELKEKSFSPFHSDYTNLIRELVCEYIALFEQLCEKEYDDADNYISEYDYINFYLKNLYDKFEQASRYEPSSTRYTGYQHLEKMKSAVDTIGEAYQKYHR